MDPLTIWILVMASLWLLRILFEELWATIRGRPSPRLERRRAREQLAREYGTPSVAQAIESRLAHRIAHPPDRRWLAELRALMAECTADAVAEARIRHHVNMRERAWRHAQQAGWRVRTGGPPPPPPPRTGPPPGPPDPGPGHRADPDDGDDGVLDTTPCPGCGFTLVTDPDELCDDCAAAYSPPPDPDPDPDPDSGGVPADPPGTEHDDTGHDSQQHDSQQYDDRKGSPMTGSTVHSVTADVRDPRTALAFADACRGFNEGVIGELEVLAANLARAGVGPKPLDDVRVLSDGARSYRTSTGRSITKYAEHVATQAEIAGDADVAGTVRRTYLDTHGADGPSAPQNETTRTAISAADCDNPAEAQRFMNAVAESYAELQTSVDQVIGAHQQQGVTGEPIKFLGEQLDLATRITGQANRAARRFAAHIRKRNDTVDKDPSLHKTQDGKYLDPAKA